jgi:hypothetical protein
MDILEFYKNNSIDIDLDFDEHFYQNEYPDLSGYWLPWAKDNGFSDKQRLFHHYYLHGKKEGRFPNLECKDKKTSENKYSISQKNKKNVYIKVQNGLANRLRTINSFYSLSILFGKNLFVCWESGPGWSDDKFTDLFINKEINFISGEEYFVHTNKIFNLQSSICKSYDRLSYTFHESIKNIFYKIMTEDFCYSGDSCLEYMMPQFFKEQNCFYSYLQPVQFIQDKIDKIYNNNFNNNTVGVHIRRGDAWNSTCKNQFKVSDDRSFFKLIDEEINKNPNVNFFLSTDSKATNAIFLNKYRDKIFYNTDKTFFNSVCMHEPKYHQDDAVVDLFLLSKTSKIIGSNWSSFSSVSSKISFKQLVIAKTQQESNEVKKEINNIEISLPEDNKILEVKSITWQFPAITEKQSFYNHSNIHNDSTDNLYIACSWANIIDTLQRQFSKCDDFLDEPSCKDYLEEIFDKIEIPSNKNTHTVCQHINWHKLLGFWKKIGIKNIHLSHLSQKSYKLPLDGLNLLPWHICAANIENPNRNKGIKIKRHEEKKYLCSFIGAHDRWYPSDIREQLYQLLKDNDEVYLKIKNSWFFNKMVYKKQIKKQALSEYEVSLEDVETFEYNTVLSDSVFSLCPEGTGPNTIRLWESMAVGSIPVLFENDWVRPNIEGYHWDDFSVTISTNDLNNVFEILKSISVDKIEVMRQNCINAYTITRLRTCF